MKDSLHRLNRLGSFKTVVSAAVRSFTPFVIGLTPVAISFLSPAIADAATPTVEQALGLRPIQSTVDLIPIDAATEKLLVVRDIESDNLSGWELVGPAGEIYRRFADTNADKRIDLWCYFNNGIEVYRDVDENFNSRPDQYRWLGTAGSRWGLDEDEDGQIDTWKQISPEEVTAEVIGALATANKDRFVALMMSPTELKELGLGQSQRGEIAAKCERAIEDFDDLAKRQRAVGPDARWIQFAASQPGVLPAGSDGSTRDITAYENVVAMFSDNGQNGQLMVGTLVKTNDSWRLIALPSVGDGGDTVAQGTGNIFRGAGLVGGGEMGGGGLSEQTQQLVTRLESLDEKLSVAEGNTAEDLQADRADVLESLVQSASNDEERDTWVRQLVDTISVAVQTGSYPGGVVRLKKIAPAYAAKDANLAAYADYAAIGSEYVTKNTANADFGKVQEWYLTSLKGFVERYPRTPQTAAAYLQLALSKEFEDEEADALDFYKKVAEDFSGTDEGMKAAGAVRRLSSEGREIDLAGTTLDNEQFRLATLKGKPVVVHYWATWCEPCKADMKLLRRLQTGYARAGLTIVGINVDNTREQAIEFLRENKLPWIQLFEPGGLDASPLANRLGVQTLPTMLLIGPDGKVVRHNVRAGDLDDELSTLLKR